MHEDISTPKDGSVELRYDHLIGRQYVKSVDHCYKLVRDFYRDNFGIELRDYVIPVNWDSRDLDLIGKIHEREGFQKVYNWSLKELRPGDLLCVAVRSSNPNHFAIYLGANEILHHPLNSLSRVDTIGEFYLMSTLYVIRHPDVPDMRPTLPSTTIEELVRARYRVQAAA